MAVAESRCAVTPLAMSGLSTVSYGMAELLVRPLPDGGIEPWLAESFTQEQPDTWRIQLRDGVRFHNGREVDAEAVVAAMEYASERSFAADPVSTGTVEATGPQEVTIVTGEPLAVTPQSLASIYSYPIFDVAALEAAGEDEAEVVAAGVYTGPFRPSAVTGQTIHAERFEDYWGPAPAVANLELRCITDAQARVSAVRAGEADIALSPPPDAAAALADDPRATYVAGSEAEATFLQFNLTQPPFDELAVRQAVVQGIDYSALAEGLGLTGPPAAGLYPAGMPWAGETQGTDLAAAQRLLADAGYQPGEDGVGERDGVPLRITYLWSEDPSHESLGILLRDQLAPLGFDVHLRQVEAHYDNASWPEEWHVNANPLTMDGLGNDPTQVLYTWLGQGGLNFGQVADEQLDDVIAQARLTADQGERDDLLRQAQELVWAEGYGVVAAFWPVGAVVNTGYGGFLPDSKLLHIGADLAPSS
ncbi:hypothetical protein JQS43_11340 [Natronosporangium hydrolyticum]|uniref:Solute-binding protein family 5 domain-containing protein n=1 Tax=Natronosporangium hydrolyticum TaxID=2811111 RepID=A0A895YMX2_9ACTN|nr:ABC transporter substrate-binding protein [Natronosporangium hydrolyticum]QSB16819.1 hypothetical protein JQS43_11340 [Natronosporangium hydrolyticum]